MIKFSVFFALFALVGAAGFIAGVAGCMRLEEQDAVRAAEGHLRS